LIQNRLQRSISLKAVALSWNSCWIAAFLAFGGVSAQLQGNIVTCAFAEALPKPKILATQRYIFSLNAPSGLSNTIEVAEIQVRFAMAAPSAKGATIFAKHHVESGVSVLRC
jgi:hypothetical protein